MPKNPFTDVWQFLTGTTGDYSPSGKLALSDPGAVLDPAARQHCNRFPELAGGLRATHRPAFWNLAGPGPDRLHVVPGHVVEIAATGVRRPAILDRTGIDQRGFRVSPHLLEGCRAAQHEALWANCLSCRTGVRGVATSRACDAIGGRACQ